MEIYTIGFTQKTAEQFFGTLRRAGIQQLVDVRLNNVFQLAGFAKREDLIFFLREICGAEYRHELLLAPTQEMLDKYKKNKGSWEEYERRFFELMAQREVESRLDRSMFGRRTTLLCSEPGPERCHRRLVLEYLDRKWGGIAIIHL